MSDSISDIHNINSCSTLSILRVVFVRVSMFEKHIHIDIYLDICHKSYDSRKEESISLIDIQGQDKN